MDREEILCIRDLEVSIEEKSIVRGFDLSIAKGEVHAIMGPNGAGKSTLAHVLAGHPSYTVDKGEILLGGESIVESEPEERALLGLFVGFQYPLEIPGVTNWQFLRDAYNMQRKHHELSPLSDEEFWAYILPLMEKMEISREFVQRELNVGFSGGEKKRNEILQMLTLRPKLAVLDETDSGLDIDSLRRVAKGIEGHRSGENGTLLITHYQRLLDYVRPDRVHIMVEGQIVHSGDLTVAHELEKGGYEALLASPPTGE